MPARYAEIGDLHADIDDHPYRLDQLLEWAERDEHDNKAVSDPMGLDATGSDGMGPPDAD
jgi:hypothetical protein